MHFENLSRLAREYRVQEQLLIYLATKDISLIAADTGENITEAMNRDPMKRALAPVQKDVSLTVFHPLYPEESKTLELIQSLYGNSFSEIARKLTALNYKSRDGNPFITSSSPASSNPLHTTRIIIPSPRLNYSVQWNSR